MADSPAPLTRLQTLPSWLLGRAAALGHRLVAEHLARAGMRMPHHAVLCGIAEHGPLAQAELSRIVRIDPKDMTWEQRERVLRLLLGRINVPIKAQSAPPKAETTPLYVVLACV